MNLQKVYDRLADIHDEFMPIEAVSQEAGQHNPCGCSICLLMDTVLTEQIGLAVVHEPQPVWTQKDIKKLLNELAELRAKFADLHDKFEAAQQELHDLRINAGIGQFNPDWSKAPPGYDWWAMDDNGQSFWFVERPKLNHRFGYWGTSEDAILASETSSSGWESSLRQRPQL